MPERCHGRLGAELDAALRELHRAFEIAGVKIVLREIQVSDGETLVELDGSLEMFDHLRGASDLPIELGEIEVRPEIPGSDFEISLVGNDGAWNVLLCFQNQREIVVSAR